MTTETESTPHAAGADLNLLGVIAAAYLGNNPLPPEQALKFVADLHAKLGGLPAGAADTGPTTQKPAVLIKKSVTPEYIICLEDGKKLKMLKRYLSTRYNLSPDQYRAKWGLPHDYPVVAPNYAAQRSEFAKKIGLGQNRAPAAGTKAKAKR